MAEVAAQGQFPRPHALLDLLQLPPCKAIMPSLITPPVLGGPGAIFRGQSPGWAILVHCFEGQAAVPFNAQVEGP